MTSSAPHASPSRRTTAGYESRPAPEGGGRIQDQAAAILETSRTPLTTEAIVAALAAPRNIRSVRNALRADSRFVRTDRDTWGLVQWSVAPYAGIRAAIREHLDAHGGTAELPELVAAVTSRFSLSRSSVTTYASAPPFQCVDGVVTMAPLSASDAVSGSTVEGGSSDRPASRNGDATRGGAEIMRSARRSAKSLAETRGCFRIGSGWGVRIVLNANHLRGSGFPAPAALAAYAGVRPGDSVQLSSELGPQRVSWKGTQPQFGTIRRFLPALGLADGDAVFLIVHDDATFSAEAQQPLTGVALADALALVGAAPVTDRNPHRGESSGPALEKLAVAIEHPRNTPVSGLAQAYRERGDIEIADLISTLA